MALYFTLVLGAIGGISALVINVAPHLPIPAWPDPDASKVTTLLGYVCTVFNVAMYASPLCVVRHVIRTRSVAAMPLLLTLGMGLCSASWTVYAILVHDDFILIPNAIGLVLFFLQLLVYRTYAPFCPAAARRRSEPLASPLVNDAEAGAGAATSNGGDRCGGGAGVRCVRDDIGVAPLLAASAHAAPQGASPK